MNCREISNGPSGEMNGKVKNISLFYGAAVFLSALILRLILAEKMPLDFDESWYLANSSLTMEGLLPYRDFFGRSPLLLYIIGIIVNISAHDIFFGRLASVMASSFSALLLYFFAKRYFPIKVAFTCGLLYALSPFPLRYGYIAVTEPVSLLFVILSVYLFMRGVEGEGRYFFFLSGIVLSMAILVRRSSAIYAAALPLLYVFSTYTKDKQPSRIISPFRRLSGNCIVFLAGPSIVLIAVLFLLGWTDPNLIFSMYDIRELWKYVHIEKTIIWNIKELGYQMLYLALFFLVFICAVIKRFLKEIAYGYFLALTATIAIVMGHIFLPTDELEGFIANDPIDVIMTIIYVIPMIFVVVILFKPWDAMTTDNASWRRACKRLLPAGIPIAVIVLLPGMELTNSLVEWMLEIYFLSVLFLFVLALKGRIEKRYDRSTARLYTGALVIVYLIYLAVISKAMMKEGNVQLLMCGILLCLLVIFLKVYFLSRSRRLWTHFVNRLLKPYVRRIIYVTGVSMIFLSAVVYKFMWETMDWTMSIFLCASMILAFFTAHIISAGLFRFNNIRRTERDAGDKRTYRHIISIPLFLCVIPFFFYYLRAWWMPIYFFEMAPGLCFVSGIVVMSLFRTVKAEEKAPKKEKKKKNSININGGAASSRFRMRRLLVYSFVTISLVLPAFMYASDPYNIYLNQNEQHPSPMLIRRVSSFLEENTETDEAIFAWPIYAFQSDRRVIYNITHPLLYKEYVGDDEYGLSVFNYPTVKEIMEYMDKTDVRFVVLDVNIEEVFFNNREYFKEYIYTRYNIVKDYGDIKIMMRA